MREIQTPRPHTTTPSRAGLRSPRTALRSGRRPSTQLISDAVTASYIHDISQRHRDGAHASESGRRRPTHHP